MNNSCPSPYLVMLKKTCEKYLHRGSNTCQHSREVCDLSEIETARRDSSLSAYDFNQFLALASGLGWFEILVTLYAESFGKRQFESDLYLFVFEV